MKIPAQHIATIKEIQRNLQQIKDTGRAPINLTRYKNLGLIRVMHKNITTASGNTERIFDRLVLTDKAKQYLNVII